MIRSILVPLDGSRYAEAAIAAACALARSAHGRLQLVLCHEPTTAPSREHDDALARDQERQYLNKTAARLASSGVPTEAMIVDGAPSASLSDCIREAPPDLIVMASHRRGLITPPHRYSVALGMIRAVGVPVLLVPPTIDEPMRTVDDFRSILLPVRLTDDADQILTAVAEFACLMQSHVTLLHVIAADSQPGRARSSPEAPNVRSGRYLVPRRLAVLEDTRLAAQRQLDRLADALRAHGVRAAARVVRGGGVAQTILAELAGRSAGLLAIMPKGRDDPSWDPAASVTDEVILNATRPVLVLPSTAVAAHT